MRWLSAAWKLKELWEHFVGALILGSGLFFVPAFAFQNAAEHLADDQFVAASGYVSAYGFLLLISTALSVYAAFKREEADDDDVRRVFRCRWAVAFLLLFSAAYGPFSWVFALGALVGLSVTAYKNRDMGPIVRWSVVFAIFAAGWLVAALAHGAWPLYVWSFVPAGAYVAYLLIRGLFSEMGEIYATARGVD